MRVSNKWLRIDFLGIIMCDMKKLLIAFFCLNIGCVYAADLVGSAWVNMTSDTSQTAKTMAINDARRQILIDKLGSYAMSDQLVPAVRGAKSADLINLIAETNIDNEKISDTAYSAKITMTVDKTAARNWMAANNIQNWLNDNVSVDVFVVQIALRNNINDWADFNRVMRAERVDVMTKYMSGKNATVELPASSRASVTIALRSAGWHTSVQDGVMRIWK